MKNEAKTRQADCPTMDELEAMVNRTGARRDVALHAATCPHCRGKVSMLHTLATVVADTHRSEAEKSCPSDEAIIALIDSFSEVSASERSLIDADGRSVRMDSRRQSLHAHIKDCAKCANRLAELTLITLDSARSNTEAPAVTAVWSTESIIGAVRAGFEPPTPLTTPIAAGLARPSRPNGTVASFFAGVVTASIILLMISRSLPLREGAGVGNYVRQPAEQTQAAGVRTTNQTNDQVASSRVPSLESKVGSPLGDASGSNDGERAVMYPTPTKSAPMQAAHASPAPIEIEHAWQRGVINNTAAITGNATKPETKATSPQASPWNGEGESEESTEPAQPAVHANTSGSVNAQSLDTVIITTPGVVQSTDNQVHPRSEHASTTIDMNGAEVPDSTIGRGGAIVAPPAAQTPIASAAPPQSQTQATDGASAQSPPPPAPVASVAPAPSYAATTPPAPIASDGLIAPEEPSTPAVQSTDQSNDYYSSARVSASPYNTPIDELRRQAEANLNSLTLWARLADAYAAEHDADGAAYARAHLLTLLNRPAQNAPANRAKQVK